MPRLKPTSKEIELHLKQLADNPLAIRAMIAGLSADGLRWSSGKKDWSVVDILAHLRACSDVWCFSIYAMLAENQPVLPLLDEHRWAKVLGYAALSFEVSFNVFRVQREKLLRALLTINIEAWERTANIGGHNHSVFSETRCLALHEVEHLNQFQEIVNKLKTEKQT